MNVSRLCCLTFCLLVGCVSPGLAQGNVRGELEKRQTEMHTKIDDLFGHRDEPIPPLDPSLNPFFRTAVPVPMEPAEAEAPARPATPPTRADSELLAAVVANLTINGIVSYNNRNLIVINQSPTPEGRMVAVEFEGKKHFVRVEEIHSNRVVLSIGSASTVLPITGGRTSPGGTTGAPTNPGPPPGLN